MISAVGHLRHSMKIKDYKHILLFLSIFIGITLTYIWFINSEYFKPFIAWSKDHLALLFISLVFIKIIGILWPPLPGGYFTIASIPAIGWMYAYAADFVGTMIGASLAYYIGKRYGYHALEKIFDKNILEKIKAVKIKKHRELEMMLMLRFVGGATLTEAVCYAAGLLGVSYRNFIISILGPHILFVIPAYYYAESIFKTKNLVTSYLLILVSIPLLMKLKKRYLQ